MARCMLSVLIAVIVLVISIPGSSEENEATITDTIATKSKDSGNKLETPASSTASFPAITAENAGNLQLVAKHRIGSGTVFSPDSRRLALGVDSGIVCLDVNGFGHIAFLRGLPSPFCFSPDSRLLAWQPRRNRVQVWDITTSTIRCEVPVADLGKEPAKIIFSPNGQFLVVGDYGDVKVLDIRDQKVLLESRAQSFHLSPDGSILALERMEFPFGVEMIDIVSGVPVRTLSGFQTAGPWWNVAFSPNWQTIAWKARGGSSLMNVATEKFVSQPRRLAGSMGVFSPDGHLFAEGGCAHGGDEQSCRMIVVVSVADGIEVAALNHVNPVFGVAFSPDAKIVATFSEDHVVLWDWTTCKRIVVLDCKRASDLQFSPDGRILAINSRGSCSLWGVLP